MWCEQAKLAELSRNCKAAVMTSSETTLAPKDAYKSLLAIGSSSSASEQHWLTSWSGTKHSTQCLSWGPNFVLLAASDPKPYLLWQA
eukprot:1414381-Amphidinium_carterae.1